MARIEQCRVKELKNRLAENNISYRAKDRKKDLLNRLVGGGVDPYLHHYCGFNHAGLKKQAKKHGLFTKGEYPSRRALFSELVNNARTPFSKSVVLRKKRKKAAKKKDADPGAPKRKRGRPRKYKNEAAKKAAQKRRNAENQKIRRIKKNLQKSKNRKVAKPIYRSAFSF